MPSSHQVLLKTGNRWITHNKCITIYLYSLSNTLSLGIYSFVVRALLILFLINRLICSQTKDVLSGLVLLYLLLNYFRWKNPRTKLWIVLQCPSKSVLITSRHQNMGSMRCAGLRSHLVFSQLMLKIRRARSVLCITILLPRDLFVVCFGGEI